MQGQYAISNVDLGYVPQILQWLFLKVLPVL